MAAGDLITDVWQVEWRSTLFGYPATSLGITDLTGWLDMPPVRSQPTDRPGRHGAFPSTLRASARIVEVELSLMADDPTALPALYDATALGEDDQEEPLVIWAGTDTPQLVYARCERRAPTTDHAWSVGDGVARMQWVATDPRRYSVAQHTATVGLQAASSGGLTFPLLFPLSFGGTIAGGSMLVTNGGNAPTWPTFTITGPVTGPLITNTDTGQVLDFIDTFTVPSGQTLVVDTDLRTVELAGVSRRSALTTAQWFSLPQGSTRLLFSSAGTYDPAASLQAAWRDCWL